MSSSSKGNSIQLSRRYSAALRKQLTLKRGATSRPADSFGHEAAGGRFGRLGPAQNPPTIADRDAAAGTLVHEQRWYDQVPVTTFAAVEQLQSDKRTVLYRRTLKKYEAELFRFLDSKGAAALKEIEEKKAIDASIEEKLQKLLNEFRDGFTY